MTALVTLAEAKLQGNIDHVFSDELIELEIVAASAAVLDYIGDTQYLFLDTGGEVIDLGDTSTGSHEDVAGSRALQRCRQATVYLVADYFRNREPNSTDVVDAQFGYGYMPRTVVAMLYSLRTPTLA